MVSCLLLQVAAHFQPRLQESSPNAVQLQQPAQEQGLESTGMAFAAWRASCALQKVLGVNLQSRIDKMERQRLKAAFAAWQHAASDRASRRRWVRLMTFPLPSDVRCL